MFVKGDAYTKRLEGYSDDTIRLITELNSVSKEIALKKTEIIATTDSEKEVIKKLKELKNNLA